MKMVSGMSVVRSLVAFAVALGIGGCDEDSGGIEQQDAEWIVAPEVGGASEQIRAHEDNPVFAVLDTELSGKLEFLDESRDGEVKIGLVATGADGARAARFIEEGASPLEIFLALASPSKEPPRLLVEDHARMAQDGLVPTAPRELSLWRTQTEGTLCHIGRPDLTEAWWNSWSSGYGSGSLTLGSFADGTTFTTGTSNQRALMACESHGSAEADYFLERWDGSAWEFVYHAENPISVEWGFAYKSASVGEKYRLVLDSWSPPTNLFAAASW